MNAPRIHNLTTGSIPAHLARLSLPMVWGILSIVSMQVADVYFIARLGHTELEAISFTFPVSMTLFNLMMGLSIGASSVISRLIGARDTATMRHFTLHAIMMALAIGALLAIIGEIMMGPVFHALGAGQDHMAFITPFMRIQFWGYMFITVPLVINAAIRASGDTFTPSLIMISAAVINIPLSYILVYGAGPIPAWGMTGAAIANVTANASTALIALYILIVKRQLVDIRVLDLAHFGASARRLLSIAIPVGLVNLLTPLTAGIITALLVKDSTSAVAAYGIIGRVEAVMAVPLMAVSIAVSPLIGQNFGAGQFDRMRETIRYAILFCILWSGITGALLMISGNPLARLFTQDIDTIHITATYFLLMGIIPMMGTLPMGWGSVWNAMGKPQYGIILSLGRLGIGTILCAVIGHTMGGWHGLFIGMSAGALITGTALHFWSAARFDQFIKNTVIPTQAGTS